MPRLYRPLNPNHPAGTSYYKPSRYNQKAQQAEIVQKTGKTAQLPHALADQAHALAEQFDAEVGQSVQTDCAKGCAHCCHQPATAFGFEAIRIARTLRETLSAPQLTELQAQMRNRVAALVERSVAKSLNNKAPCPLLVNNQCSIYTDRPLTCRLAHSLSVKKCRTALAQDRARVQIPISIELLTGVSGIIEAVFEELPKLQLDAQLYELNSAVLAALEQPDAALRWAQGDRAVLSGCVKDDT